MKPSRDLDPSRMDFDLVVLDVTLNKAATYPFGHRKHTLGISARTTIERSRWGMDYGISRGMVGDAVELCFELEAMRDD